jgi:hypothetical protein
MAYPLRVFLWITCRYFMGIRNLWLIMNFWVKVHAVVKSYFVVKLDL